MSARCRAVEELDQVRRLAGFRQQLKEGLEYSGAAEPPEPLPYAVPFAEFAGECTPGYAVYREVVDGFQEFAVIMPWLSTARLRRIKHVQHDRPIALRHSRQHVRLPDTGHAVIRTKPDSGIRQKRMSGIPSTRPRHAVASKFGFTLKNTSMPTVEKSHRAVGNSPNPTSPKTAILMAPYRGEAGLPSRMCELSLPRADSWSARRVNSDPMDPFGRQRCLRLF